MLAKFNWVFYQQLIDKYEKENGNFYSKIAIVLNIKI